MAIFHNLRRSDNAYQLHPFAIDRSGGQFVHRNQVRRWHGRVADHRPAWLRKVRRKILMSGDSLEIDELAGLGGCGAAASLDPYTGRSILHEHVERIEVGHYRAQVDRESFAGLVRGEPADLVNVR